MEEIKQIFERNNIFINSDQIKQFEDYYQLLLIWNQKFNLTAITDKKDVIIKHFLDSLKGLALINDNSKIIDIGAGAGFPSIPLKILNPSLDITLVDSVNKKVTFLNEVIDKLNLKNIRAIHSRIEDLAHQINYRESFDFVLARAVAKLNTLCEYALPFLKQNGKFLAYKSEDIEQEIQLSKNAINTLGGKIEKIVDCDFENMVRKILVINKLSATSSTYPRKNNKPRTAPL